MVEQLPPPPSERLGLELRDGALYDRDGDDERVGALYDRDGALYERVGALYDRDGAAERVGALNEGADERVGALLGARAAGDSSGTAIPPRRRSGRLRSAPPDRPAPDPYI